MVASPSLLMRGHGTCSAMTVSIPLDSTPSTGKTVEDSLILTIMADNKKIEIKLKTSICYTLGHII